MLSQVMSWSESPSFSPLIVKKPAWNKPSEKSTEEAALWTWDFYPKLNRILFLLVSSQVSPPQEKPLAWMSPSPSSVEYKTDMSILSLCGVMLHPNLNSQSHTGCESHWALHTNSNKCIWWVLYIAVCRPNSSQCHLQPGKSLNLSRDQISQELERPQTAEGALTAPVLSSSILSGFNNAKQK